MASLWARVQKPLGHKSYHRRAAGRNQPQRGQPSTPLRARFFASARRRAPPFSYDTVPGWCKIGRGIARGLDPSSEEPCYRAGRRQPRGPTMIDLKTEDGIAVVTLAHGKASALDIELCEALTKCFEELRAPEIRAVVLTGQGRIFSAGVDLVRLSSGGTDYVRKFLPVMNRAFDAVFFLPKPLVAALNGHAIAGGCVLACCADRRVMARGGGRIGVTELLVGVPFPALAFEIMRFATPPYFFSEGI